MKNKSVFLILFWGFFFPTLVLATSISFDPLGVGENNYEDFFKTILQGILNLIALLAVLFMVIAGVIYLIASNSGNDNLIETAKKIWTGALIGLALSAGAPTFINQIIEIIGGSVSPDLSSAPSLSDIISNTLSFLLSVVGILAIIGIVINSILFTTSFGDTSKAEKAKKGFNYSLLGLIFAGSALILVKLVVDLIQG